MSNYNDNNTVSTLPAQKLFLHPLCLTEFLAQSSYGDNNQSVSSIVSEPIHSSAITALWNSVLSLLIRISSSPDVEMIATV